MRPLRLNFTAFGPYADTTAIDFEALSDRGVFLVHGATGAGKTTLLDALSFALYGVTSGGERTPKQMRSDFASSRVLSEVTLDFSARNAVYRIHRVPEQERKKKRGDGVTVAKGEVRLAKIVKDSAGRDVEETLATKVADVDDRVRLLLGLTAEQFRQVVVLPQGRFRELLVATSTKRQEILESLFGAERLRAIEDALSSTERERRDRVQSLEQRADMVRQHAAAEALNARKGNQSVGDVVDVDVGIDIDIEQEHAALTAQLAALKAEAKDLADRGRELREEHVRRTLGKEALAALKLEQRAFDAWSTGADSRAAAAERLHLATRAAGIRAELEQVQHARRHVDTVAQREAMNEREFVAATSAVTQCTDALARLQANVPAADVDAALLRESLPQLIEAERLRVALHRTREDALAAQSDLNGVVERKNAQKKIREKAVADHATAQQRAFRVDERRQKMLHTMRGEQQLNKVRALAEQITNESDKQRAQEDEVATLEARVERNTVALDHHRQAEHASLAATWATSLVADHPCPVCGSVEHPSPAESTPVESAVDASEVDVWVEQISADTLRLQQLQADVAGLRVSIHGAEQRQQGIWEGIDGGILGGGGERVLPSADAIDGAIEKVSALLTSQQNDLAAAEAADDALAALALTAEQAQAECETLERAHAALTERDERATADAAAASTAVDAHLQAHPIAETTDHATALQQLRDLDAEKAGHAKRLEASKQSLGKAKAAAQTAEALLAAAARDKEAAFVAQRQAEAARTAALLAAGFDDVEAAESASLSPADRDALQIDVDNAIAQDRDRVDALARCVVAAEKVAPGDATSAAIDEVATKVAANEKAQSSSAQTQGSLASRLANLERWGEELRAASSALEDAKEEHRAIVDVAATANGQNPQKITFQRWVLATLLDDVLETASVRLLRMTRGRFAMKRRLDPKGRGGRGLDLDVVDHETQAERPVSTLSGGESFLAALALALGLADAVRARAGGVLLDAIFLDEGFAGLDSEALDLALATLQELMDSGRMVGIISHVDELKERIPRGLEIVASRSGSRAVPFGGD